MILAPAGDGLRLVTQPEHAALAGSLAEAWGADGFAAPDPLPAVRLAVHAHDDGWQPVDRHPTLTDDGTPRNFHEQPADRWTRLYRRGIDEVARADRYAGLLVSLHGSGLRRRRYGLSPSWGDTPPAFAAFVRAEERRQQSLAAAMRDDPGDDRVTAGDLRLLDSLHERGRSADGEATPSRLWHNYRFLQALDALSLRICGSSFESAEGDSRAEPFSVQRVPTTLDGEDVTLRVSPAADSHGDDEADAVFRVDPYPFAEDAVWTTLRARRLASTTFADDRALREAYHGVETESLTVVLVPEP